MLCGYFLATEFHGFRCNLRKTRFFIEPQAIPHPSAGGRGCGIVHIRGKAGGIFHGKKNSGILMQANLFAIMARKSSSKAIRRLFYGRYV
jgi:hypothetical protein